MTPKEPDTLRDVLRESYKRVWIERGTPSGWPFGLADAMANDLAARNVHLQAADAREDGLPRLTHGRHCRCTPCANEDWTNPRLAPCGMHGPSCPRLYDPYDRKEYEARAALAATEEPATHPVWHGTGTCPYCGIFVPHSLAQPAPALDVDVVPLIEAALDLRPDSSTEDWVEFRRLRNRAGRLAASQPITEDGNVSGYIPASGNDAEDFR